MTTDNPQFYEFEDFRLDAVNGVLFRGDAIVNVTPKAVEILRLLVERSGEIVSKEDILARVWPDSFVEEANLSHHIFKLRNALGESDLRKVIETVPKRGYRFVGKLRQPEQEPVTTDPSRVRKIVPAALLVLAVAGVLSWFLFSGERGGNATSPAPDVKTIAVLPFVNETGDADVEYLADGLAETLISRFSGMASFRVRPYSAVSRFKGTAMAPETIGQELNVQSLLTGRVTKRGESVRLFLSLIDVGSGYQTWGKQYERDFASLAALQGEIMRDVAEYLPGKLSGTDQDRMLSAATRNSEAYVLYLKGRYQLNRKTVDGLKKAVEHFDQAVAIDPSFALAYSGIADAYNQMGLWVTMPPGETFPRAKAAAEHALSLDAGLAEARTALASAKFYYEWDFEGAEREFRQAIRDNPDYSFARESYGVLIYETNPARFDEAVAELNTASAADPVAIAPYFWRGAFYYFEGKYDLALRELEEAQNIDPGFTLGLALKGAVYREKGDHDQYLDHWLKASPLEGVDLSEAEIKELRGAYQTKGLKAYEIQYAELLQRKSAGKYVSPLFVAMHYSIAGETEPAFAWLEKAMAERSSWLVELKVDPAWKNLHADPRYKDLLKRIGFPE
jgi:DNA-binding winged helix-turn-helix (wHTH) protein/TolB-like protein/lipoprotein NlpI